MKWDQERIRKNYKDLKLFNNIQGLGSIDSKGIEDLREFFR